MSRMARVSAPRQGECQLKTCLLGGTQAQLVTPCDVINGRYDVRPCHHGRSMYVRLRNQCCMCYIGYFIEK